MAAPIVEVGGVARRLIPGTLHIDRSPSARGTGTFRLRDLDANYDLDGCEPVVIKDLSGTIAFEGWMDTFEVTTGVVQNQVADWLEWSCAVKDHHYLADKREVNRVFENMLSGDIVKWIIDNILVEEQVTKGNILDGILIDRYPARLKTCAAVFDDLADMNNFIWKIPAGRAMYFRGRTEVVSAVAVVGTNVLAGSVRRRRRNQSYRNVQHMLGGVSSTASGTAGVNITQYVQEIEGDGLTRKFPLDFGIQAAGATTVEVDRGAGYAAETFGLGWNPAVVPAGKWYAWGFYPFLHHDSAETVLGVGEKVRVTWLAYPVFVDEFVGDGTAGQEFTLTGPAHSLLVWVDRGDDGSYVVEDHSEAHYEDGSEWQHTQGSNVVRHRESQTALAATDRVRFIAVDARPRDVKTTNQTEIDRRKACEGNTTSGIVEAVDDDSESTSAAESKKKADGKLHRWAHETDEIEYQTWLSTLADGEKGEVDFPEIGMGDAEVMIEHVEITDIATLQHTADVPGASLLYRIRGVRSPALGAEGGAFGRSVNPASFPEFIADFRDRTRSNLVSPPEGVVTQEEAFTPPVVAIPPDQIATAKVWIEGDDHTGTPAHLINRIVGESNIPSFGSNNAVITNELNGHTVLHFDNWDVGVGHDGYRKADYAASELTPPFTVIVVVRVDHWSSGIDYGRGFVSFVDSDTTWRHVVNEPEGVGNWKSTGDSGSEIAITGGPGLNVFAIHALIVDEANSKYRIDRVQVGAGNLVKTTPWPADKLHIGNFDQNGGDIAAFALYLENLETTGKLEGSEKYFADRFAL